MHPEQHQGPREGPRHDDGNKTAVLVVENDPTIRGMLRMMLDLEGYPVRAVAGGADALRELGTSREPRVVLVNHLLPDVDGMQVVAAAASHPALRQHRYVLMSTCSSCEVQHSIAPHTGLLLKPFSVEDLLDVVEDAASDLSPSWPETLPLAQSSVSPAAIPKLTTSTRLALVAALAALALAVWAATHVTPLTEQLASLTAHSPTHR